MTLISITEAKGSLVRKYITCLWEWGRKLWSETCVSLQTFMYINRTIHQPHHEALRITLLYVADR